MRFIFSENEFGMDTGQKAKSSVLHKKKNKEII
jgi:hypothetical protein